MDILKNLFERCFHAPVERVQPVQGQLGGSGRKIVRLESGNISAVGVLYDVREENVAFVEFSRHFRKHGLPVPEIYADDLDHGAYLEEDLGDLTLFEFLSANRAGEQLQSPVIDAYRKVVDLLPRFQIEAARDLNYEVCYPRAVFDAQSIAWDLNYFKYYFLKLAGIAFNEQSLEDDFARITKFLLSAKLDFFLYRDFQSRNILLRGGEPWFVDYQGGRKGALQYDLASLLFDAKADLPPALRQQLLDRYITRLADFTDIGREEFMRHYYGYVYVRIMQALGAYGFRGFYERKSHFLQSVPYAIKNIRWLLENVELPISLPSLTEAFRGIVESERLRSLNTKEGCLIVRICSFSYRGGIPRDDAGHGGGFVFDARSIPNPGREQRFKPLTGKDAPVIEFLNQQPSTHEFLAHAASLVEASVDAYLRRGFTSLTVLFGCTGGQHRSVYFAEQLAKKLCGRKGVEVVVRHLELENMNK
jgi:aminoglycoside/choline kinase family phosphotransferase